MTTDVISVPLRQWDEFFSTALIQEFAKDVRLDFATGLLRKLEEQAGRMARDEIASGVPSSSTLAGILLLITQYREEVDGTRFPRTVEVPS
jgi:hypothetical protein